jgi:glutathione peroxidase
MRAKVDAIHIYGYLDATAPVAAPPRPRSFPFMRQLFSALSVIPALLAPGEVRAGEMQTGRATDFTFTAIDGTPLPLSSFAGKVVLVVNTASFCGFTKQYDGLQKLYSAYKDRGLVVLGVPSNEFGQQEPGTNAEIAQFCQGAFNITFPLAEKVSVIGGGAHPFYKWAASVLGPSAVPKWNFHKYLVGADGKLIAGFATSVEPSSPKVVQAIEAALTAAGSKS